MTDFGSGAGRLPIITNSFMQAASQGAFLLLLKAADMRIVFEGIPGAGKTTLSNWASRTFGFPLIPEWIAFSEEQWRCYPLIRPHYQCNDEMKDQAARLCEGNVLMDRNYVGGLAYAAAQNEEELAGALHWYRRSLAEDRLRKPDLVLHLLLPPESSASRQPRALSHEVYARLRQLHKIAEFYRTFFAEIEPETRLLTLDATLELPILQKSIEQELSSLG